MNIDTINDFDLVVLRLENGYFLFSRSDPGCGILLFCAWRMAIFYFLGLTLAAAIFYFLGLTLAAADPGCGWLRLWTLDLAASEAAVPPAGGWVALGAYV